MMIETKMRNSIPLPILNKLREDPRMFFKFLHVFDKEAAKLVPFVLNDAQEELLDVLLANKLVVVVKARQLGVSTLIRAYFLWKAFCEEEPTKHAIISYTRDSADHLHSIDKGFYSSLPKPLQRKLSKSSARTLQFNDTGAELRSFTAGGKGGATRSFTFSSAHISEFAFFDEQDELLANTIASVGDGQVVIETTTNGPGDTYHRLCMGAPENGWKLCFFPWHKHKPYYKKSMFGQNGVPPMTGEEIGIMQELGVNKGQMYWRRTQISSMGIEKFTREYPADVEQAFLTSTNVYFPPDVLDDIEIVDIGGPDKWYCDPLKGDRFSMGVDVAQGGGGDYSAITVVSSTTLQPIYHYKNNLISPSDFADKVFEIYYQFGEPYTIIEANGPGHLVIHRCKEWGMKNLYRGPRGDWNTRKENKMSIFDHCRELLSGGHFHLLESGLWSEMRNTIMQEGGAPTHPKGSHDDVLISFLLALWAAKERPAPQLGEVKRAIMEEFIKSTKAARIRARGPLPFTVRGKVR